MTQSGNLTRSFTLSTGADVEHAKNDVAQVLRGRGFATLLLDLCTVDETQIDTAEMALRFDLDMLAERLLAATDSVIASGHTYGLPIVRCMTWTTDLHESSSTEADRGGSST